MHPRPRRANPRAANARLPHARRPRRNRAATREREREEAYALNPDQPPVIRATAEQDGKSALVHGHGGTGARAGKARPVPALLMKRKSPEPENA